MKRRLEAEAQDVELTITAEEKQVDGYMEVVTGMFVFTGLLVSHKASWERLADGRIKIYINAKLLTPPLGGLGLTDIPEHKGGST